MDGPPAPERLALARETLRAGALRLGLPLSPDTLRRFERYAALLREGKQRLSLTSLTDPVDQALAHFLDSLTILALLPAGPIRLIDVGSGAGFPGLPLVIVRPRTTAVLLEATARKGQWLAETIDRLGVPDTTVLTMRAEDAAHLPAHRGRYDVAVARAVARLSTLCELCLPFLRVGGRFVAPKSAAGAGVEVPQARRALATLGATLAVVHPVALPDLLPNRVLVAIDQQRPAPDLYPRRSGVPAKRPL